MNYPTIRELDGVYFRIERNGKWHNICFSDMTESEQNQVCENRTTEWLISLAKTLANTIHQIGDQFDLTTVEQED